jgi:hypothetical protein
MDNDCNNGDIHSQLQSIRFYITFIQEIRTLLELQKILLIMYASFQARVNIDGQAKLRGRFTILSTTFQA